MSLSLERWLPYRRPGTAPVRLRLFCFPFAGGGASAFQAWRNRLPADIELCAVHPQGRVGRLSEPAFQSLTNVSFHPAGHPDRAVTLPVVVALGYVHAKHDAGSDDVAV